MDNNMETLVMAKNKIGLVRALKTQGLWPAQKVKPSSDVAYCAKQIVKNDNDA